MVSRKHLETQIKSSDPSSHISCDYLVDCTFGALYVDEYLLFVHVQTRFRSKAFFFFYTTSIAYSIQPASARFHSNHSARVHSCSSCPFVSVPSQAHQKRSLQRNLVRWHVVRVWKYCTNVRRFICLAAPCCSLDAAGAFKQWTEQTQQNRSTSGVGRHIEDFNTRPWKPSKSFPLLIIERHWRRQAALQFGVLVLRVAGGFRREVNRILVLSRRKYSSETSPIFTLHGEICRNYPHIGDKTTYAYPHIPPVEFLTLP